MKKSFVLAGLSMALILGGCQSDPYLGTVDHVKIPDWKPSDLYSDEDIEAAMKVVKDSFPENYKLSDLLEIRYPGDNRQNFQDWADRNGKKEAICLEIDFQTGDTDKLFETRPLNPNNLYGDFKQILVRDPGEPWEIVDGGYG